LAVDTMVCPTASHVVSEEQDTPHNCGVPVGRVSDAHLVPPSSVRRIRPVYEPVSPAAAQSLAEAHETLQR
jgi:hypothetical protein